LGKHQENSRETMRLSVQQQTTIRSIAADIVGSDAKVWLFGSRADDAQRGGDVDIYVEVERRLLNRVALAIRLAARLERGLSGLPVDVVIKDAASAGQPIHEIAKRTGVRL
jgi:uncharacterized protein